MEIADPDTLLEEIVARYSHCLSAEESTSLSGILRAFCERDRSGIEEVVRQYAAAPEDGIHVLVIFSGIVGRLCGDHGSSYHWTTGELWLGMTRPEPLNYDRYRGGDAGGRYMLRVWSDGRQSSAWYDDYGDRSRASNNRRSYDPGFTWTLRVMAAKASESFREIPSLDAVCLAHDRDRYESERAFAKRQRQEAADRVQRVAELSQAWDRGWVPYLRCKWKHRGQG